jgi:hypothetical protein
MSFRLVSISSDLKHKLEMAARLSKTNELSVITLAFEKGYESIKHLNEKPSKRPYAHRSLTNSLIELPSEFNALVEDMAALLDVPEFRAIHLALELGVKPILEGVVTPVKASAPVREKRQVPIKVKQEKIPAPPKKATPPSPPEAAPIAPPPPPVTQIVAPPTPPVTSSIKGRLWREPVCTPRMVHLFRCATCNAKIEVPSEEYQDLKAGLLAAKLKLPRCKKHGGYRHLLGSKNLGKIAS